MPILKPGQDLGQDIQAPELQGVAANTNSMMFQDRLLKLFNPFEYVIIKNVDEAPLYWQYQPVENETETTDETGRMHQTYRKDPELWGIKPGDSEPMVGACAMRALDVLYKNIAARKTLREKKDPNDPTLGKDGKWGQFSFNFSDANIQEEVIKQAFIGKAQPTFTAPSLETQFSVPAAETRESETTKKWPTPTPDATKVTSGAGSKQ